MKIYLIQKKVVESLFLALFFLFLMPSFLGASLINPKLVSQKNGYKEFNEGCKFFEKGNWSEAIDSFNQAIKKSCKPFFDCASFSDGSGETLCDDEEGCVFQLDDKKNEVNFIVD